MRLPLPLSLELSLRALQCLLDDVADGVIKLSNESSHPLVSILYDLLAFTRVRLKPLKDLVRVGR